MKETEIIVVRTGTANIASVLAALKRLGASARVSEDGREIAAAGHVVVPGVGAFGAAMARLTALGLRDVISERVRRRQATLAICLGLQMLASASEESPGVAGLGLFPETVGRFPSTYRVPQMGWNLITAARGCRFLTSGYAYFANSYRLQKIPAGFTGAEAEYSERFVAALESGGVLACQFHPELSGAWGMEVLRRWYELAPKGARC